MLNALKFEWRRVFSRRNVVFFCLLAIVAIYFVALGVSDYTKVLAEKVDFEKVENSKSEYYVSYEQYAVMGSRVMFMPSPLSIFFRDYYQFGIISANLDVTEVIDISNNKKGRELFFKKGNFGDLSGVIFIFGTLIMMYMGFGTFQSFDHYRLFKRKPLVWSFICRLFLLDGYFVVLFGVCYLIASFSGISFSPADIAAFIDYGLFSLLLLNFFFVTGMMAGILGNFRRRSVVLLSVLWLLFVLVVPEIVNTTINRKAQTITSVEYLNLQKFKVLLGHEQKSRKVFWEYQKHEKDPAALKAFWKNLAWEYFQKGYVENKNKEESLQQEIRGVAETLEYMSSLFPGNYYHYLVGELSGSGYSEYSRFVDHMLKLREDFFKFYLIKRYDSNDRQIESFIKGDENIFMAASRIPKNFWGGILVVLLYFFAILVSGFWLLKKRSTYIVPKDVGFDINQLEREQTYFIHCRDDGFRGKLFDYLAGQPGVLAIDRVISSDIDPQLSSHSVVDYFSYICGIVNPQAVDKTLENFSFLSSPRGNGGYLTDQELKKIYCSVLLNLNDNVTIVVNDILLGEGKGFEREFISILMGLKSQGKRIVYLSSEMYMTYSVVEQDEIGEGKDFNIYEVNFQNISMR